MLTDQRMPEMPGTEFLEKVRAQLPKAKRMLMTAYQDISVVMAAINELDVYQVILKPFEQNELVAESPACAGMLMLPNASRKN